MTDRFANPESNIACTDMKKYCGRIFKGIVNKLDYIQGFEVNAIWISPIQVNTPDGYHGYWAMDFTKVIPDFSTEEARFEALNVIKETSGLGWMCESVMHIVC